MKLTIFLFLFAIIFAQLSFGDEVVHTVNNEALAQTEHADIPKGIPEQVAAVPPSIEKTPTPAEEAVDGHK